VALCLVAVVVAASLFPRALFALQKAGERLSAVLVEPLDFGLLVLGLRGTIQLL